MDEVEEEPFWMGHHEHKGDNFGRRHDINIDFKGELARPLYRRRLNTASVVAPVSPPTAKQL
jgi:hypothetical protein